MSAVENGRLAQTSVSQVDLFLNCALAWWFQTVHFLKPDQSASAAAGDSGHKLFALHLRGQPLPKRAQLLKAVSGAIVKGELPKPGPDLLVELRGDGQEKFSERTCECGHPFIQHDPAPGNQPGAACKECSCLNPAPAWIPLRKDTTLWVGGVPWELFIDLTYRRGDVPVVLDHKFKAKDLMHTAKQGHELVKTVQMPIYALAMLRRWPDAREFDLTHHYVSRTGVESFMRTGRVSTEEILERRDEIAQVVEQMKGAAAATDQTDVPFNRSWCDKGPIGLGCPHQSICRAFKENKVKLKPEEEALFADLDNLDPLATTSTTAPETSQPAAEDDEEAKAMRALEAARAKKKKAEADAKAKAEADAKAKEAAAKASTVLPPDAPKSNPELAAEGAKAKGKAPAASGVSVTLHFASAAEAVAALTKIGK
jgi:hypothetical protein